MSDVPLDRRPRLELDELISRIERQQEETRKFVSEQHKLMAEADKLRAEERKLGRDRFLAPWLVIVATVSGLLSIASLVSRWKGWG